MTTTVNNLGRKDFEKHKKKQFRIHDQLLKHYCGFWDIKILKNVEKPNFFSKKYCFTHDSIELYPTKHKFSSGDLYIPKEFDAIMTAIMEQDCGKEGIFRICESHDSLKESQRVISGMFAKKSPHSDFLQYFRQQNIYFLCNLFTKLLNIYSSSLMPTRLINLSLKFLEIKDSSQQVICFKILLISLPEINRCLLEAMAFFFQKISKLNIEANAAENTGMSLNALSRCVFPSIFFKKPMVSDMLHMKSCASVLLYIFENMKELIHQ